MKKTFYIIIFLFISFGQLSIVFAECPDLRLFFKEINPAKNTWSFLYDLTNTYQGGDDGIYGEGYSDFVVQSLAKYWDRFDELISLIKKDPSFRDFVLRHIDATTDLDDLNLLLKNVQKLCTLSDAQFCKEIEKAALTAIKSIESIDNIMEGSDFHQ